MGQAWPTRVSFQLLDRRGTIHGWPLRSHSRHAQLMRMENLFEEIESKVLGMLDPGSDI